MIEISQYFIYRLLNLINRSYYISYDKRINLMEEGKLPQNTYIIPKPVPLD